MNLLILDFQGNKKQRKNKTRTEEKKSRVEKRQNGWASDKRGTGKKEEGFRVHG